MQTYYVEQIASRHCVDDRGQTVPFAESANVAYFEHVMREAGLTRASALICDGGPQTSGVAYRELLDVAEAADLLLNITGHLTLEPLMRRLRRKAYSISIRASRSSGTRRARRRPLERSRLPLHDRREHRHARLPHPVRGYPLASHASTRGPHRRRGCNSAVDRAVHDDRQLARALRSDSTRFNDVRVEGPRVQEAHRPAAAGSAEFEIALDIHPADARDLHLLRGHGWRIVDPRQVVPDPQSFDDYILGSDAECSAAQGVYVATNSGWFSDRTARYLAAGKPALVQDTGFSRTFPVGEGLIAFRTVEEAVRGVDAIQRDPRRHQQASRALAAEFFDSNTVIGRLLDEVGVAA